MTAAKIGFMGINKAVDWIPDQYWDKIPAFKPKLGDSGYSPRRKQRRNSVGGTSSRRSDRPRDDHDDHDDYDDYDDDDYDRDTGPHDKRDDSGYVDSPDQPERHDQGVPRPPRGDDYYSPPHEQQPNLPRGYADAAPPFVAASHPYHPSPTDYNQMQGSQPYTGQDSASQSNPRGTSFDYNSSVRDASFGDRTSTYNPAEWQQQQRGFDAPQNPSADMQGPSGSRQTGSYPPPLDASEASSRRYNPSRYRPADGALQQATQYSPAMDRRSGSPGSPTYSSGSRRGSDGSESERRDGRGRTDRKSRRSNASRSRSRGVQHMLHDKFDVSERGILTGAAGAIAGGLLGRKLGRNPIATFGGAVVGAIGSNYLENSQHKKQMKHGGHRRSKSESRRGSSYDDDGNDDRRVSSYRDDGRDRSHASRRPRGSRSSQVEDTSRDRRGAQHEDAYGGRRGAESSSRVSDEYDDNDYASGSRAGGRYDGPRMTSSRLDPDTLDDKGRDLHRRVKKEEKVEQRRERERREAENDT